MKRVLHINISMLQQLIVIIIIKSISNTIKGKIYRYIAIIAISETRR